tara:strand:- start:2555 stop:3040 length:486 start_codon:yes stop_codon:yes gene_type:complete
MNARGDEMAPKLAAVRGRVGDVRNGNRRPQHRRWQPSVPPALPALPPPPPPPPLSPLTLPPPPPLLLSEVLGSTTSQSVSASVLPNVVFIVVICLGAARVLRAICDRLKRAQHDALIDDGGSPSTGPLKGVRLAMNRGKQNCLATPRRRAEYDERTVLLAA